MQMLMFSAEEPHANHSALQDFVRDLMIHAETSCSPILPSLHAIAPVGWFGRTCPASCPATEDGILVPSSGAWASSGMGSPTECLTLSSPEHATFPERCPSDGDVCSLSDILETGDVPQRYFLTARACRGILRRAEKRGKALPSALHQALQSVAERAAEPQS